MITTHDSALDFVRQFRDDYAPRFTVSLTATRVAPHPGGVIHVRGPAFDGRGERSAHLEYALPVEPGDLRRRALSAMVAPRRLPDYMRAARAGS